MQFLLVFIGGGIGSLVRYLLSLGFKHVDFLKIPWATFLANFFSSLIVGFIVAYFLGKDIENQWIKSFLLIGFCGGFSTFSTFALENYTFLIQGSAFHFIAYTLLSVTASILAIFIGVKAYAFLSAFTF
jgi:CrcB protein